MNLDNIDLARLLPLLIPIVLLELGLLVWALLDVIRRERVRGGNKVIWILVIVLINLLGPIVYFIFGREEDSSEKDTDNI
jgi:hypothetical protein